MSGRVKVVLVTQVPENVKWWRLARMMMRSKDSIQQTPGYMKLLDHYEQCNAFATTKTFHGSIVVAHQSLMSQISIDIYESSGPVDKLLLSWPMNECMTKTTYLLY